MIIRHGGALGHGVDHRAGGGCEGDVACAVLIGGVGEHRVGEGLAAALGCGFAAGDPCLVAGP